ncbi:MAG TPA: UDP-N-acetylglucosamine 2-epimerase (non-hydrolyzing) [Ruminiclostridium sp.]|nr:UDP-N-acetylglucosamine 2-epimerase (non-hydrolyzing) [Ruminiclostridium sp.]
MKIMTVVGARPQFIKAAAVSRVLRKENTEILVHTGQHYDENMSGIFFEELKIPKPDFNLGVGSASHGKQTGEMLIKIEELLLSEKPDAMLVYGDTNSTLAGALAASKLHVQVAHVEAGLRSFNKLMPEEQNRVLTDHISDILFCPTGTAADNLRKEGITSGVYEVGDVMCDALYFYKSIAEKQYHDFNLLESLFDKPSANLNRGYYLATIHRAENTDGAESLKKILAAFENFDAPVIFPVHPRTRPLVASLQNENNYKNIHFVAPVGYIYMLYLAFNAKKIVTDSGGLQKEAYLLKVPCVTVREQTEWIETLRGGWNILAHPETDDILRKVSDTKADPTLRGDYYGDGHAAEKICEILKR